MKLDNQTDYPTRVLRSIMCAVHSAEPRGRLRTWDRLTVKVVYSRGRHTGYAFYHGLSARLRVPKDGMNVAKFAALWRHELWHLYGIPHADYPPNVMHCKVACVDHVDLGRFGGLLDAVPPPPPPKPTKLELQELKVARLLARRAGWATKAKRADRALAKIDRSLGYYAREGIEEAKAASPRASTRRRKVRRK